VVLPLLIMMGVWHYLNAAPPASSPRGRATASAPAASPRPTRATALKNLATPSDPKAVPSTAPEPTLLDTLDDYLARWQDKARQDPQFQRDAAALLLRKGDYAGAIQAFDRLLVGSPDDEMLLTGKAMALGGLGRHEDAVVLLENVVRRDAANTTARYNYAVALMRAGERDAALRTLQQVLQTQPTHSKALFNQAVLLQAMGRWDEAMKAWLQVTQATPPLPGLSTAMLADAWSHRGEIGLQLKKPEEAEKAFLQVVDREPRSAQAWCNVGIARAEQVRRSDALTALNIALKLDPDFVPALNQAAYIQAAYYRDTGDPAYGRTVVEYCRRSLSLKPNQPNVATLLKAVRTFDPTEEDEESRRASTVQDDTDVR
jgi:tetratricopeptide (TPR) repeat protein